MQVDFGRTVDDYLKYRAEYPSRLFDRLKEKGIGLAGQKILDTGAGTGYLARPMAVQGAHVTALDPSLDMLKASKKVDEKFGVSISYVQGVAEQIPFKDSSFQVVTAGQCWHWFQGEKAASEIFRVLESEGKVAIVHFDWLPISGNIVYATEELILHFNPEWKGGGGTGIYPHRLLDLTKAGFRNLETFSFDTDIVYSHESWRGRIRASAGVGASMSSDKVVEFDLKLKTMLEDSFPEPLKIPHRVFTVIGTKLNDL